MKENNETKPQETKKHKLLREKEELLRAIKIMRQYDTFAQHELIDFEARSTDFNRQRLRVKCFYCRKDFTSLAYLCQGEPACGIHAQVLKDELRENIANPDEYKKALRDELQKHSISDEFVVTHPYYLIYNNVGALCPTCRATLDEE